MAPRALPFPSFIAAFLLWLLMPALSIAASPQPPNIIWVVLDSLRWDRVGAYRPELRLTPFLDSLAQRSYVFWRAYATAPWTMPSVASMFTSRYPWEHGVTHFRAALAAEETTLAEALRDAGYSCVGFTANVLIRSDNGFAQGFDEWHVVAPETPGGGLQKTRADQVESALRNWLERADRHSHRPVFLYLHLMDTHFLYAPPADALDTVLHRTPKEGELRSAVERLFFNPGDRWRKPSAIEREAVAALYDAEVLAADRALERVIALLARHRLMDRALLIVVADHGEQLYGWGALGHGRSLHEVEIRVPLLLSVPGQTQRRDDHSVVSLVDLAPTVLLLSRGSVPQTMRGRPLAPAQSWWQRLGHRLWREGPVEVYAELSENVPAGHSIDPDPGRHRTAVIRGDLKLVENQSGGQTLFRIAENSLKESVVTDSRNAAGLARALARIHHSSRAPSSVPTVIIDETTKQRMRALGYAP